MRLVTVVKAGTANVFRASLVAVPNLSIHLNLGTEMSRKKTITSLLNFLLSFLVQKFSRILLVGVQLQDGTSTNFSRPSMVLLFAMMYL